MILPLSVMQAYRNLTLEMFFEIAKIVHENY